MSPKRSHDDDDSQFTCKVFCNTQQIISQIMPVNKPFDNSLNNSKSVDIIWLLDEKTESFHVTDIKCKEAKHSLESFKKIYLELLDTSLSKIFRFASNKETESNVRSNVDFRLVLNHFRTNPLIVYIVTELNKLINGIYCKVKKNVHLRRLMILHSIYCLISNDYISPDDLADFMMNGGALLSCLEYNFGTYCFLIKDIAADTLSALCNRNSDVEPWSNVCSKLLCRYFNCSVVHCCTTVTSLQEGLEAFVHYFFPYLEVYSQDILDRASRSVPSRQPTLKTWYELLNVYEYFIRYDFSSPFLDCLDYILSNHYFHACENMISSEYLILNVFYNEFQPDFSSFFSFSLADLLIDELKYEMEMEQRESELYEENDIGSLVENIIVPEEERDGVSSDKGTDSFLGGRKTVLVEENSTVLEEEKKDAVGVLSRESMTVPMEESEIFSEYVTIFNEKWEEAFAKENRAISLEESIAVHVRENETVPLRESPAILEEGKDDDDDDSDESVIILSDDSITDSFRESTTIPVGESSIVSKKERKTVPLSKSITMSSWENDIVPEDGDSISLNERNAVLLEERGNIISEKYPIDSIEKTDAFSEKRVSGLFEKNTVVPCGGTATFPENMILPHTLPFIAYQSVMKHCLSDEKEKTLEIDITSETSFSEKNDILGFDEKNITEYLMSNSSA